jgi:hypothetical protein
MVMRPTPLPQDPTNYANAGLNIFNAMSAGNNIYTENQLRDAQEQAGGLAAAGDYDGARNAMLARGYPGQAVQYQGLASAARTRQEEATTKSLNSQVGGLLAAGRRQEAAQMLYQAGRLDDARKVMQQGQADQDTAQTAQKTTLTQQAGAAAAQGDWDTAAKLAYQAGDIKTAGFYQEKAQEGQKAQTYQGLARTQAIRAAAASAKSQAEYDQMHDALIGAGYPEDVVAKYRDFAGRDKHLMELDAHQKDLEGRLAPEDREKLATSRARSETATRTPEEIAEGRTTGTMLAKFSTLDAAKEEWKQYRDRLGDPLNILATKDEKGKVVSGGLTEKEFENSIGRLTTSEATMMPGGIPMREFSNAYGRPINPFTSKAQDERFATQLAVSKFLKDNVPVTMERLFQQIQPAKGQGSEADRARIVKLYQNLATSSNMQEYRNNLKSLDIEMNAIISGQEKQRESLRQRAKELNARPGVQPAPGSATPASAEGANDQMQPGMEYAGPNGHKIMLDPNNPSQIIDVETGQPVR